MCGADIYTLFSLIWGKRGRESRKANGTKSITDQSPANVVGEGGSGTRGPRRGTERDLFPFSSVSPFPSHAMKREDRGNWQQLRSFEVRDVLKELGSLLLDCKGDPMLPGWKAKGAKKPEEVERNG